MFKKNLIVAVSLVVLSLGLIGAARSYDTASALWINEVRFSCSDYKVHEYLNGKVEIWCSFPVVLEGYESICPIPLPVSTPQPVITPIIISPQPTINPYPGPAMPAYPRQKRIIDRTKRD